MGGYGVGYPGQYPVSSAQYSVFGAASQGLKKVIAIPMRINAGKPGPDYCNWYYYRAVGRG